MTRSEYFKIYYLYLHIIIKDDEIKSPCWVAFLITEKIIYQATGKNYYKSYDSFRVGKSRHFRLKR